MCSSRPAWALGVLALALALPVPAGGAEPAFVVDLAQVSTEAGLMRRVHGSVGHGDKGVPVAGGVDCDGDGFPDYAMASMQAGPLGRPLAGEVYLVFGNGTVTRSHGPTVS